MKYANLTEENKLWKKGYKHIACLDEVGRGPLAGPVVAAAVTINSKFKKQNLKLQSKIKNLRDSKKLSAKQREEFYKILTNHPLIKWGVGIVSEKIIDKINIKNAAELAMMRALANLKTKSEKRKIDFLIIDGNAISNSKLKSYNLKLIVRGDEKVFSCALASIVAKVTRDRLMMRYDKKYPQYRFDLHKGYPTKLHRSLLKKHGPCKIHRKSFYPVYTCKLKQYLLL